ncbi:MAG: transposase, partial [Candidatus Omnitrophica bacterium]|nr:transposase [Candidatus Omnitrophota bacterium]
SQLFLCHSQELGFHKYQCPHCGDFLIIPHSCKSRICSSCGKLATDHWISSSLSSFPNVAYQHVIFTIPDQLRDVILFNRPLLLNALFKLASSAIISWIKPNKHYIPGITMILHTFGRDLKFNPHIHMLITCGGLCLNHNKWLNNFFIPEKALKPIWKDNVISFIRKSYKNNSLILPAHIKPILGSILNNLYSKIWYVNFGRKLDNASFAIIYIGRYTKRPVIAESRILSYDGEFVIFSYDDQISSQTIYSKLPVDEFIARLIRHIPDKGFRQIRYAGIFALRVRSKLLPTVNNLVEHMDSTDNKGDLSCPPRFTCSVCPDGFMQPIDYTSPSGRTYKTDPKSIKPVQIISF